MLAKSLWQVGGVESKFDAVKRRALRLMLPRRNYNQLLQMGLSKMDVAMLIPVDDILDVIQHGLEGQL